MAFNKRGIPETPHLNDSVSNLESLLIIERFLEERGQRWIHNINKIESFLIRIVETLSEQDDTLRSSFILRRLPTFTTPFINKNEYAIILKDLEFTLVSPLDPRRRSTTDKVGIPNFCQTEIFYPHKDQVDSFFAGLTESNGNEEENVEKEEDLNENVSEKLFRKIINDKYSYCSHEFFKKFANALMKAANTNPADNSAQTSGERKKEKKIENSRGNNVQIVGPHLLHDVLCGSEVDNIMKLIQSNIPQRRLSDNNCIVRLNHLKSLITISYEDTEVTVRPCLFLEKGYARVHSNLMERIPFYHSSILNIGQSLTKGCLIFPTSFETLWTLQFWPQESHIICTYHSNSLVGRLFKLFSGFCMNPANFWEALNNNFLIGGEDFSSLAADTNGNILNADFAVSTFLYELENFCKIEDWAPRNLSTRLIHLLRTTVDCYEKGFHSHYFTKINILRGFWRTSLENFDREEKSALRELDDIEESTEDTADYCDKHLDDFDDEFGFFDALDIKDDNIPSTLMLTSDMVYKSVNPFQSLENVATHHKGSSEGLFKDEKKPATLSKIFGSKIRKFSDKLSRSKSDAGLPDPMNELKKQRSMLDIASGFEESIAQMRRENSSIQSDSMITDESMFAETTFSPSTSSLPKRKARSCSVPQQGTSHSWEFQQFTYENEGLQLPIDSIYLNILQKMTDLPPSDRLSDPQLVAQLDNSKRKLESQEELIISWCRIMDEIPRPKYICPHAFSPRQIQYLSLVIRVVSQTSPGVHKSLKSSKLPSWEISGDILKIILHQMRSELTGINDSFKEKRKPIMKSVSFSRKIKRSFTENTKRRSGSTGRTSKFSFRRDNAASDICKNHAPVTGKSNENEMEVDAVELALEDPETAATNRMLNWLWQLRNSEIGRLSSKANKYLEELFAISLVNSHFLDEFSEEKIIQNLAIRSAVAVSRIISDEKFPAHVPLLSASKKGWAWAEMILSLAGWNLEKGHSIKAEVLIDQKRLQREIEYTNYARTLIRDNSAGDPDADAVTLAFHSELATPIGWNDFEDPSRPGPYAVPILIFSSQYFKLWEVVPGNIVHILLRLKKFNSLQHVGSMLIQPHRKTALNEVRKLNKSLSFRSDIYDDNVMSKTFKRLASLRATRQMLLTRHKPISRMKLYTCHELGCSSSKENSDTVTTIFRGHEFDCTRM